MAGPIESFAIEHPEVTLEIPQVPNICKVPAVLVHVGAPPEMDTPDATREFERRRRLVIIPKSIDGYDNGHREKMDLALVRQIIEDLRAANPDIIIHTGLLYLDERKLAKVLRGENVENLRRDRFPIGSITERVGNPWDNYPGKLPFTFPPQD